MPALARSARPAHGQWAESALGQGEQAIANAVDRLSNAHIDWRRLKAGGVHLGLKVAPALAVPLGVTIIVVAHQVDDDALNQRP